MQTIKQIENKLKEVAISNNMVGDSVDLIIKLLAYSHFESVSATRVALLEANPDRAVNINSKLEHAMNEMYSVFRGKNSILKLRAKVTGNPILDRFQKTFSDRNNSLYFSHCVNKDGEYTYGKVDFNYGQEYDLYLIKADEIVQETLSVSKDNLLLMESLSGGISEDYELKEDIPNSVNVKMTKDFANHIDSSLGKGGYVGVEVGKDPLGFELTRTDYGVRFYSPTNEGFNSSIKYSFKYVPFLESNINLKDLSKINIDGFEIYRDTLEVIDYVPKESLENFLYNLKKESLTQSRVRSNDDVIDEFKSAFPTKVRDAALGEYDFENDIMTIHYIPFSSHLDDSPFKIGNLEQEQYINRLMYYVTDNIEFSMLNDSSNAVRMNIEVNMYIDKEIDVDILTNKISEYEYSLGAKFNYDEFVGFVNNMDGVKYAKVVVIDDNGEVLNGDYVYRLSNKEYFILSENFTYSYKL